MKRFVLVLCALALLGCGAPAPDLPQAEHRNACNDTRLPDEVRLERCGALLVSGELAEIELAEAYHARGFILMEQGRLEEALADYDRSITLEPAPTRASVYFNRGRARVGLGRYGDAIADFTRAVEINPTFDSPLSWRARAHADLGNYAEAAADIERVIDLSPESYWRMDQEGFRNLQRQRCVYQRKAGETPANPEMCEAL
ncbi:MAG: tetratricopeptide repeat protein [Terricaulis sp.]|nr:tetratricopeptide repeat protein [Terricaulis sp.]